jgi:creatinine amidohydrolase
MDKTLFQHYTRDNLVEMARKGYAVVVPLASTEQHGHHLPVGTDSIVCEYIVSRSVERASKQVPIIRIPVFCVGCSGHHLRYGGTISFSSSTYLSMLKDVGESLVICGFKKIIFINGHGGNQQMMVQTANDLAVKYPVWTAFGSYSSIAREALKEVNAEEVGQVAGHAGGFETSLIMALAYDLVRLENIKESHPRKPCPPYFTNLLKHKELTGVDGYTDAPNKATAEKGNRYLEKIVDSISDWLVSMCKEMDSGDLEA